MQKEFGAPGKKIGLAGVHFSGALVLASSFNKLPFIFKVISEQGMELGAIFAREKRLNDLIGARELMCLRIGQRKSVGCTVVVGLQLRSALKIWKSLLRLSLV